MTHEEEFRQIKERLARVEQRLGAIEAEQANEWCASDRELDDQWGDPEIRRDPKRWDAVAGGSYVGKRYSECPPEYLDVLAEFLRWRCGMEKQDNKLNPKNGRPWWQYSMKDARRAAGWARRIRMRGQTATRPIPAPADALPEVPDDWASDIPF